MCEKRQAGWNIEPVAGRPSYEVAEEEDEVIDACEEKAEDLESGISMINRNNQESRTVASPLQANNHINIGNVSLSSSSNNSGSSGNGNIKSPPLKSPPTIAPPPGHISSRSVSTGDSLQSPPIIESVDQLSKSKTSHTESKDKIS